MPATVTGLLRLPPSMASIRAIGTSPRNVSGQVVRIVANHRSQVHAPHLIVRPSTSSQPCFLPSRGIVPPKRWSRLVLIFDLHPVPVQPQPTSNALSALARGATRLLPSSASTLLGSVGGTSFHGWRLPVGQYYHLINRFAAKYPIRIELTKCHSR